MKKMIVAATVAATAALAPALAQAQTPAVEPGVYANLGYAHIDASDINLGAVQAKLGYRFNNWVGLEGEGAFGFDDDTSAGAKIKLKHELAAYVVGYVPIGPNVDLLARVGYGTTKLRAKVAGVSNSDSYDSVNLGVGAQYHFDGKNGIRVEYLYTDYNNNGGHANVFGVAYSRRF